MCGTNDAAKVGRWKRCAYAPPGDSTRPTAAARRGRANRDPIACGMWAQQSARCRVLREVKPYEDVSLRMTCLINT